MYWIVLCTHTYGIVTQTFKIIETATRQRLYAHKHTWWSICIYQHSYSWNSGVFLVCWCAFRYCLKKTRKIKIGRPDRITPEPELYIENYTLVCQPLLTQA